MLSTARLYRTVLSKDALLKEIRQYLPNVPKNRVEQDPHRLAHAASASFILQQRIEPEKYENS
jgi:uncharacterized protein involved in propanediol utilization